MQRFRFLTIPTSHYCEKVRWAMDLKGVPYAEEMHMPVFHIRAVKKAGGGSTVPVLVTEQEVLADSTDILQFLERHAPQPALFPEDPEQRRQVEELEELFDETLGTHSRRILYATVLHQKELFFRLFPERCPRHEVRWLRFGFPLFRMMVRRAYRINPDSVARSRARVDEVFHKVESLLAEGRGFLVGDSLSSADITFACLSVPLVMPEHYFVPLPTPADLPEEHRAVFEGYRESIPGRFARRLFREYRGEVEATTAQA